MIDCPGGWALGRLRHVGSNSSRKERVDRLLLLVKDCWRP